MSFKLKFPRVAAAWKMAPTRRRIWWLMPLWWWAITQCILFSVGWTGNKMKTPTDESMQTAAFKGFNVLYHETLGLTLFLMFASVIWFFWIRSMNNASPPIFAKRFQKIVAVLGFAMGAVLFQGAWRCGVPPLPYNETTAMGIRLFVGIQSYLLIISVASWSILGLVFNATSISDFMKCIFSFPKLKQK